MSDRELILQLANIFQVDLQRRWTEEQPNTALDALISAGQAHYVKTVREFVEDADAMAKISLEEPEASTEPAWKNIWFSGLDSVSLYAYVKRWNPRLYLEIGSGNSTMFVRRAIRDHQLSTRIVSIDPNPRADINTICDEVIRQRLQYTDWRGVFSQVQAGDIVFFDGSHRSFQNTDVTVFFTEILPLLPAGVLIGIHDIFLPADYVEELRGRFYSEQYLLACWLLADGGRNIRIEFPAHWVASSPSGAAAREALAPLYKKLPPEVPMMGGAFWISKI